MSSAIAQQGIVSILRSECDQITKVASLKRTLSADMSSKKWLAQNGFSFSPMRRIASSEELSGNKSDSSFSSHEHDEKLGQDDVWRLIQSQKKEVEKPGQADLWASIVSKKANEEEISTLPPPYIHPLVKKSSSTLSKKSLEVCTESLGSETGSDGFSSYAPSETGDAEEDKDETQVITQSQPKQEKEWQPFALEEPQFSKYNFSSTKKSPLKPFPPPLPSLARRDGPSLQMQPRREDGRLVLEAVSIPSKNCFHAHRQDGRLLLTLANDTLTKELDLEQMVDEEDEVDEVDEETFNFFEAEEDEIDEADDEMFNFFEGEEHDYLTEKEETDGEEDDENDDEVTTKIELVNGAKDLGIVMDQAPSYSSEVINVHRSALVIKKLIRLNNKDPKWTEKLKKSVNLVEMEMETEADMDSATPLSQSLPRPPMVTRMMQSPHVSMATASFNACDYFWRTKPATKSAINAIVQQSSRLKINTHNVTSPESNPNQEMVLLRGDKADYLVVRGCKENKKRPLLFWEPYCIATS